VVGRRIGPCTDRNDRNHGFPPGYYDRAPWPQDDQGPGWGWASFLMADFDLIRVAGEAAPERQVELNLIQGCRERFGSPPRQLSPSDAKACQLTLSPEIEQPCRKYGDALLTIVEEQQRLRDRGQVYWAHLIQANSDLFKPDDSSHRRGRSSLQG
jgi:hypothetical protein